MTDTTATHALATHIIADEIRQYEYLRWLGRFDRTAAEDQHIVVGLYRELHDIAYAQVA